MKLEEFEKRYREARRRSDDLMPGGGNVEFYRYPLDILQSSSLLPDEAEFLSRVGLPKQAAPYLIFGNLYEQLPALAESFDECFCLGFAGRQRLLVVDKNVGDVQCLELSGEGINLLPVNYSLAHFAECLCLFEEWVDKTTLHECYGAMQLADPFLKSEDENFWKQETEDFLDNVLNALNEAIGNRQ
jgi:hypothetical protein